MGVENSRERARQDCIDLMNETLAVEPRMGMTLGTIRYSGQELIAELENATAVGDRLIDMFLEDQEDRIINDTISPLLFDAQNIFASMVRHII